MTLPEVASSSVRATDSEMASAVLENLLGHSGPFGDVPIARTASRQIGQALAVGTSGVVFASITHYEKGEASVSQIQISIISSAWQTYTEC